MLEAEMRLTMKQPQAVTAVTVQRYRKGSKKMKQQILDEFIETTGYCRAYAGFVLRSDRRHVCLRHLKTILERAELPGDSSPVRFAPQLRHSLCLRERRP
jgi:hypothetical protein